ncbi:rCG44755 [Rattus norvegicus]|uniref:RCG44755 n=1 Tax=Rattus norvegicus TaxID=10116 RepID=A6I557_RAT|nr:rCG44755 [Rattus norvegicus]
MQTDNQGAKQSAELT